MLEEDDDLEELEEPEDEEEELCQPPGFLVKIRDDEELVPYLADAASDTYAIEHTMVAGMNQTILWKHFLEVGIQRFNLTSGAYDDTTVFPLLVDPLMNPNINGGLVVEDSDGDKHICNVRVMEIDAEELVLIVTCLRNITEVPVLVEKEIRLDVSDMEVGDWWGDDFQPPVCYRRYGFDGTPSPTLEVFLSLEMAGPNLCKLHRLSIDLDSLQLTQLHYVLEVVGAMPYVVGSWPPFQPHGFYNFDAQNYYLPAQYQVATNANYTTLGGSEHIAISFDMKCLRVNGYHLCSELEGAIRTQFGYGKIGQTLRYVVNTTCAHTHCHLFVPLVDFFEQRYIKRLTNE